MEIRNTVFTAAVHRSVIGKDFKITDYSTRVYAVRSESRTGRFRFLLLM